MKNQKKRLMPIIIGFILFSIISCKKENNKTTHNPPVLTTIGVFEIAQTTAKCGGIITSDGGSLILARGTCWSNNQKPTLSDSKTIDSMGIGAFRSIITGLKANSTYYVRAYAISAVDTAYGQELSFSTIANLPILTTSLVKVISPSDGTSGGNVSSDGGATVSVRGICWSTQQLPTIADNKTTDGNGIGSFNSSIIGLSASTTYYIRAYATNTSGTGYGNQISFSTLANGQITDIDGNVYNTVAIGTQTWMKENLQTTHYRNGDDISTTLINITAESTGKFQWACNGSESNVKTYGRLYTWHAANDSRNICPIGWHLPSDDDFKTLENYLILNGYNFDGTTLDNKIAKSLAVTSGWVTCSIVGTVGNSQSSNNSSGFTGIHAGYRNYTGTFYGFGNMASWWSSTEFSTSNACCRNLYNDRSDLFRGSILKSLGLSVRCIKD